jgi:hypothetical protein
MAGRDAAVADTSPLWNRRGVRTRACSVGTHANALVELHSIVSCTRSHECERGTQECVRHSYPTWMVSRKRSRVHLLKSNDPLDPGAGHNDILETAGAEYGIG